MEDRLTEDEKKILLKIARQALEATVKGELAPKLNLADLPERLRQPGASFVTLTYMGELRGCIGALEPVLPLVEDVREHAMAAAQHDYRFFPVQPDELPYLKIEISRLTLPCPLIYSGVEELLKRLQPGIDGVVLRDGFRRATFLPQVWEKLPTPAEFLDHLCLKLGVHPQLWRSGKLKIETYSVEEFQE